MRSVAIVGFAESSLPYAKESNADEMWSVNFAWNYAVPRIDRLFEIHPLWFLAMQKGKRDKEHLKWLQRKHPFPIYTYADYTEKRSLAEIEVSPYLPLLDEKGIDPKIIVRKLKNLNSVYRKRIGIPASIPFPFTDAYKIFENIKFGKEEKNQPYLTSTMSYMAAMAIIEGFDVIEIYGAELSAGTEYVYQKAGLEMLCGYAAAKGIIIKLVEHSKLLNSKLYHEGAQMINRQTCERHVEIYTDLMQQRLGETNAARGKFEEAQERGADEAEMLKLSEAVQISNNNAFLAQGAKLAMQNAIKEIDLDNPVIELINQIQINDPNKKQEKRKNERPKRRTRRRRRSKAR